MGIIATASGFSALSTLFVALRLFTRFQLIKNPGADDYTIAAALVCALLTLARSLLIELVFRLVFVRLFSSRFVCISAIYISSTWTDLYDAIEVHYGVGQHMTTLSNEQQKSQLKVS
jgi:hypothetical protein